MLILHDLHTIDGTNLSMVIHEGFIQSISHKADIAQPKESNVLHLQFSGNLCFPGLINSHDHLDFNLFPKLGDKIYGDYMEWGPYINSAYKDKINEVLKVPRELRVQWGCYKNLLNGITTVVHHGTYVRAKESYINIFQRCNMLHSMHNEQYLELKLNKPYTRGWPYVIHIGEGTNEEAYNEIDRFIRWNFFKRPTIGIHGVAMDERQAKHFKALVWCPDSNCFMFNKTAKVEQLKKNIRILFGTDSTLTAHWSIWEQLRLARKLKMLTDEELYESLQTTAAKVWALPAKAALQEGFAADIVITKQQQQFGLGSFFNTRPDDILMVIANGNIVLFDEILSNQLKNKIAFDQYSKINISGSLKYVKGDLNALIKQVNQYSSSIKFPISY